MSGKPYHHGDLRRVLLTAAVQALTEAGPAKLSLRDLARRAGVSHAAPVHHFRDKAGLLTAVATEGFDLLADALVAAEGRTGDLLEIGVAYVRFAVDHRAYFEVMFRPELYHPADPRLLQARQHAGDSLRSGLAMLPGATTGDIPRQAGLAAWSIAHGFATLWLGGALPEEVGDDLEAAARPVLRLLFETG
ncbi:TetR/AcrR family transcriptional regulator [Protofrankia symbiont of Coriaria ruscifolia]|uniref:TetR/AcrR family transcriptional regulator n=1 Tax=Protofrankia symbiont of Coriaria ruscifolia TaxID=1306542 RepID=UPI0010416C16|nr:TetR/AcrR family transcriptional regulator [Protofrankia symbiont of Coriaria ruscifolia]